MAELHQPFNRQNGSTSVEYAVLTFVVVTVLFLPLPGLGSSLVETLMSALRQFQANTTYLYSLP
ncbi:hypothetical protein [Granulosicoccus antarcticus]|uniref:Uncharacterized protein n=1 Tax=Granulosicoccus antarcticus IMCC3135 TaxID=1192854 RepID=A0A2Z2NSW6_9GAMM|nr:hypothetical protein [Granulosicoccus antarcticus]ASJ74656.1 hypothetical protein IMCC3135_22930 [Granulosicoccus antarcticus IMCC3135]